MKTLKTPLLLCLLIVLANNFCSFMGKNSGKRTLSVTGDIKGKVTDKSSGETLAFVNVLLKDKRGIEIAGTLSNAMGYFYFQALSPGEYSLEANAVGYGPKTEKPVAVKSGEVTTVNLELVPGKPQLAEIVIHEPDELMMDKVVMEEVELPVRNSTKWGPMKKESGKARMKCVSPAAGASPVENRPWGFNTEQYDYIAENEFRNPREEPLSTFSIDVDRASYSNIRRFINNGQTPPPDAVRIEELINYFSYNYPQPEGEHPFSINTEMTDCPWNKKNKLVQIGIQGKKISTEKLPPGNLVFLIDVSGSMSDFNKLPLVKQSLRLLVNQLRTQDRVALVVYAGAAGLVLESTPGADKEKILDAIERLESGGSTAGGEGIKLAYKVAADNFINHGNNRVILATDGDFNVGVSGDGDLVRIIEEKREIGIFLTVLGYGMGNYKDSKMEKLADKGNGNYSYIDNIMEAKKTLVSEMGGTLLTIAKDVKIQVEFNPAKVGSYKLIGYENRLLNKEDFNDDTKDAGELGSGHTVTALYEITLAGTTGESTALRIDPLRYQTPGQVKQDATGSNELLTVKFRYKEPAGKESKLIVKNLPDEERELALASNNLKFSAAVAQFGLLLRDSKFKGDASYGEVVKLAKMGKGEDAEGYRSEFIRLVELYELQAKK